MSQLLLLLLPRHWHDETNIAPRWDGGDSTTERLINKYFNKHGGQYRDSLHLSLSLSLLRPECILSLSLSASLLNHIFLPRVVFYEELHQMWVVGN